jgi:hypothetical protein
LLSGLTPEFEPIDRQLRTIERINAAEFKYSSVGYNILRRLCDNLEEALPVLAPDTGSAPIWNMAADIAWRIARNALQDMGAHAGTTRDSVAVKFAAAAVARFGFLNDGGPPSTEAIAKRITSTEKM